MNAFHTFSYEPIQGVDLPAPATYLRHHLIGFETLPQLYRKVYVQVQIQNFTKKRGRLFEGKLEPLNVTREMYRRIDGIFLALTLIFSRVFPDTL